VKILTVIKGSLFKTRKTESRVMAIKRRLAFNPISFLAKVGVARGIGRYRKTYDCAIEMRWISCPTGGIVQFCSDVPRDPV